MDHLSEITQLEEHVRGAARTVVFTGLGFGRSDDIEQRVDQSDWSSHASLENLVVDPAAFWAYYFTAATEISTRLPSSGHYALARLQDAQVISTIIAQSADHLLQKAGATDVVEMHGSVLVAKCERCNERYGLPEVGALMQASADGVPRCTSPECNFPLRPVGTLWGESLADEPMTRAWELAAAADLFVVIESSLRTMPLSLLPSVPLKRNATLVMIGMTPTQYDRYARMVIRAEGSLVIDALATAILGPAPSPRT